MLCLDFREKQQQGPALESLTMAIWCLVTKVPLMSLLLLPHNPEWETQELEE